MSLETRLESLHRKHDSLENALNMESSHPAHKDEQIKALKVEKLRVKDQIENLRHS